jgi:NADH-quinone oxidoreductase subunit G
VGALCSRDFLYKQRVWFLQSRRSICAACSTGCAIHVDSNRGAVYRLRPRYNPNVNHWWMCDDGRRSYKHLASSERLTTPRRRSGAALNDARWPEVISALRNDLAEMVRRHGGRSTVALLSPMLTCEEAYLLARFLKSLSPDVRLALGRVPTVGEDDHYPKARDGSSTARKFTIHGEKCPNRRGVQAILEGIERQVMPFDAVLEELRSGAIQAVFLTGGYPAPWLEPEEIEALSRQELMVLVDILESTASEHADYVLPGAAWAEKEGSYVNHAGVLQTTERAVRPPAQARAEGHILWELAQRDRLYNARDVLGELAADLPTFAACAGGNVAEYGARVAAGPAENS